MKAEGWYRDPFGIHEDRWFSADRPTALVRDGGVESKDAPPDRAIDGPLVEVTVDENAPTGDLGHDPESSEERDPSKGLWDQGLSMYSDYYEAGHRAGEHRSD